MCVTSGTLPSCQKIHDRERQNNHENFHTPILNHGNLRCGRLNNYWLLVRWANEWRVPVVPSVPSVPATSVSSVSQPVVSFLHCVGGITKLTRLVKISHQNGANRKYPQSLVGYHLNYQEKIPAVESSEKMILDRAV